MSDSFDLKTENALYPSSIQSNENFIFHQLNLTIKIMSLSLRDILIKSFLHETSSITTLNIETGSEKINKKLLLHH